MMARRAELKSTFSMPGRQIAMMLMVLGLVLIGGTFLANQIRTVFAANVPLNAFIGFVFLIGVIATFRQVLQIIAAVRWLRRQNAPPSARLDAGDPPQLISSMAPLMREGRTKKRIAASSTRSMLESIAVRLDEARDITRYIVNLLIFLGLLGTFWGLSLTVPAVVDTIRNLAPQEADVSDTDVFARLMTGLETQLGGMGTAFASSLVGLAGSLVVGLLDLFAGHGQNRFYRELEDWLTSFTRLGLVSEGEGAQGALVALLDRVDEGLARTAEFTAQAEAARIKAEDRVGTAAEIIKTMVKGMQEDRSAMTDLIRELHRTRDSNADLQAETLSVLKSMEKNSLATAHSVTEMTSALGRFGDGEEGLGSLEAKLRLLTNDIAAERNETVTALREELRTLIDLIEKRDGKDRRN